MYLSLLLEWAKVNPHVVAMSQDLKGRSLTYHKTRKKKLIALLEECEQLQIIQGEKKRWMRKHFELEKKIQEKYKGGKKRHKTIAWSLYQSFEAIYLWMLYNSQ